MLHVSGTDNDRVILFQSPGAKFHQANHNTDNTVIPSWGVNWNMLTAGGSQGFQSFLVPELFMSTWFMTQPQLNPIIWFISAVPGICPINTNLLHFVSAEACKDGDGRPIKLSVLLCHCNFGNFF